MQEEIKKYATMEEAIAKQDLCTTCGKPELSLIGAYKGDEETYYFLERCDVEDCRLHCQCSKADQAKVAV